jgi:uncharacterized RDD family membrane protein YckC
MKEVDKSKRAFNFFLDSGIIFCVFYLTVISASGFVSMKVMSKFWTLGYAVLMFFYYVIFETTFQQTPAKMINKTYVVTIGGGKPGFFRIVVRTLVRYTPFDLFSYMFGIGKGQHDYFSKTIVTEK